MPRTLPGEEVAALLAELDVAQAPSPDAIRQEIINDWLIPSTGGHKELHEPSWRLNWNRPVDVRSLLHVEPTHPTTSLTVLTSGLDGHISGYRETTVTASSQARTALNSTRLDRKPANYANDGFVRGKSTYYPFRPGGLGEVIGLQEAHDLSEGQTERLEKAFEKGSGGIRTVPPGFTRGLDFGSIGEGEEALMEEEEQVGSHVEPIYQPMLNVELASTRESVSCYRQPQTDKLRIINSEHPSKQSSRKKGATAPQLDPAIDKLLPTESTLNVTAKTTSTRRRPVIAKRDWAHVVDVNREIANFSQLVPDMAREYPFELDTFQKEAIYHMELGESVFVAAHTSAGKTVVAEYAIALAVKHMTRAIYTSPIKALSNQKFRDFQRAFEPSQVGILTGDVQINPEASCLIMTTEILRSMLYKGADLIRDVEWVIFDEVHYVNDLERGVVWEEVIIMLPDHVNIILLSATVPNTKEFADWVGRTKKKDIYVISTPKRPVPLEHYLYAGKELHKIVDSKGQFLGTGYKEANESLKRKQEKDREAAGLGPLTATSGRGGAAGGRGGAGATARGGGQNRGGGNVARAVASRAASRAASNAMRGSRGGMAAGRNAQGRGDATLWIHLIGLLKKKELLPVVVFTFSKKRCEENAASMPNTDLLNAAEKSEVHVVIEKSLTRLKGSDKMLPQILNMRQLLGRGVGVHHGGLLPIVKEIVELLFARGLVKVLFATETFAMGVNMPAKCVVFANIRKHDGRSFRDLLPGEYTQMSGRAGRRGLDKTGTVIIVADSDVPETTTLTHMLLGQPTKLQSQFRLTYSMILNLLRVEALRVEEMIKRSFSENASQRLLPEHEKKVVEGMNELKALKKLPAGPETEELSRFYDLEARLVELNTAVLEGVLSHPQSAKVLSAGHIVILTDGHFRDSPAVILKQAPLATLPSGVIDPTKQFFVLAFVPPEIKAGHNDLAADAVPPRWPPRPNAASTEQELTYELAIVPITSISLVTASTMKASVVERAEKAATPGRRLTPPIPNQVDVDGIAERHRRTSMEAALAQWNAMAITPDLLRESDWSKIRGLEFRTALNERDERAKELNFFDTTSPDFDENYRLLHVERTLQDKIATLRMALSEQNLELLPDYEQRIAVLKELQFIDENSTVLIKGRVGCEINSANELVLTELILDNTFATFEPEEVVALLSCFIFQEKTDVEPLLTPKLEEGKATIVEIADRVEAVQSRHRANFADDGQFGNGGLKFGLVEVVYEWAKGMAFSQITALTDVQEGTIVRAITRLDETCREVRDAARIVGNSDLFTKMEQCQLKIRRDIVFCASLYF